MQNVSKYMYMCSMQQQYSSGRSILCLAAAQVLCIPTTMTVTPQHCWSFDEVQSPAALGLGAAFAFFTPPLTLGAAAFLAVGNSRQHGSSVGLHAPWC